LGKGALLEALFLCLSPTHDGQQTKSNHSQRTSLFVWPMERPYHGAQHSILSHIGEKKEGSWCSLGQQGIHSAIVSFNHTSPTQQDS
jgi:hypothetical protein